MRIRRNRTRLLIGSGGLLLGGMAVLAVAAPGQPVITGAPPTFTNQPPAFSWNPGGGGSGVFDWTLSGPSGRSGTETGTGTGAITGLTDGLYSFSVTERPAPDDPDQNNSPAAGAGPFLLDTDPPDAAKPAANGDTTPGWFNAGQVPVSITSSCQQGGSPVSGPALNGPPSVSGNFTGTYTATCSDAAGNSDVSPGTLVRIDVGAPSLNRSISPPDGAGGWHRSPAVVNYTCTDDFSGIAGGGCPADTTVTAQGETTIPTTVAGDVAGNLSAPQQATTVRRDSVDPPAPAITGITSTVQLGSGPIPFAFSCGPDATSGVASCVGSAPEGSALDVGTPGTGTATLGPRTVSATSTDVAGNSATTTFTYSVVDTVAPTAPVTVAPADITNQVRPTFSWSAATDAGVGIDRYVVRIDSTNFTVPVALGATGTLQWTYPVGSAALPAGNRTWQVRAVDATGRQGPFSAVRSFRIDPSAPDPPTITGGPRGFTRDTAPSFAFAGLPGAQFTWRLEVAANDELVAQGGPSPAGSAAAPSLGDGQYRFRVSQTNPAGTPSGSAVVVFTVDTVRPSAPAITSRPGTTGDGQPTFGWTGGEPGATFQWRVVTPAGAPVLGPGSVAATSVRLPSPLPGGSYLFQVRQLDQAGNESDWSAPDAFTIVAPPNQPAANPPSGGRGTVTRIVPRTRNAKRLSPRPGVVVRTLRPTLRWTRVRNASLYNVQIYRVVGRRNVKVLSAFPRGNRIVVPAKRLKAGQRYVWRVWPYFAKLRRYSRNEHGMSWFDVHKRARAPKARVVRRR